MKVTLGKAKPEDHLLLVLAGYEYVDKLARAEPDQVRRAIAIVNIRRRIVDEVPSTELIADWIRQAQTVQRALPGVGDKRPRLGAPAAPSPGRSPQPRSGRPPEGETTPPPQPTRGRPPEGETTPS